MTPAKKKILIITSSVFTLLAFLFIGITYTHYLNLKNVLIEKISHKATVLFGQRVAIGDCSFGLSGKINLHDIVISNPEGFEPGHLLTMKRLSLDLRLKDLARGEFSFRSVEIRSPELTLITGEKGRMNVSDELKRFLSEKGTTTYQIDELRVRSGVVSFENSLMTMGRDIDLSMKNLSSREDAKAQVSCSLSYAGNAVRIDGWAYVNSPDKNFSIAVSSGQFGLSPLKETLQKYGVDADTLRAAFIVGIEGDRVKGCRVSSRMQLKTARSFAFYRDTNAIRLECDAFYDIPKSSLAVNDLSLHEGDTSLMRLRGTVTDLGKHPSYAADVRIDTVDLSHFNFLKGAQISGEVTSDAVRIKGNSDKWLSEVSGTARLKGGAVRSADIQVEKVDAYLTFATDSEISMNTVISAHIISLRGYRPGHPADVSISLRGRGTPEKMAVMAGIHLSPVSLKMQDGGIILLEGLDSSLEGTLSRSGSFTGRASIGMKGIAFDDHKIPVVNASLAVDYRKNLVAITDFRIDTEDIRTSVGRIDVLMDEKRSAWSVAIRNMNALYPAKELRANNTDLVLHLRKNKKGVSGEIAVSSGEVTFQGIPARATSGTIQFDENDFSFSLPLAEIAGGKASLRAKGKSSKGPFPVEAEVTVEHIDLGVLSRASQLDKLAYGASGTLKRAVFSGTMDSLVSLQGNIVLETENVSLMRKDNKKMVLKNMGVNGDAACSGQDCTFRANMVAGNIRAAASGGIKRFADKERVASMRVLMPETKLTDVRTSLWDSVPDGLLYGGLDGYLSSDVALEYSGSGIKATGHVRVTDMLLQGENGEYSVGPVNGIVPFLYDTAKHAGNAAGTASFEPSEFAKLSRYYSRESVEDGYQKVTVGSLQYGFRILDTVSVWIKPEENSLNIGRLSANMFGGKLNGSARVDFSDGLTYRGGVLLEGLSLAQLCEEIEPVKGYISGKVDGVATIKGSGAGMAHLIGKADFWSYSSGREKTKISKEFLQKIGGPSLKAYLGDRSFDKGVMSVYLQNGFVIFRELEISHRNILGVADLSVKVAPYNNRIEIDHLLWAMTEAAQRARDKQ